MKPINITLAIILLVCLLSMPYGYYTIVRIVAMVSFSYLAIQKHHKNQPFLMLVFAIAAIIFQPFLKFPIGRNTWNIIDVTYAIVLTVSCFFPRNSSKQTQKHNNYENN